MYAVLAELDPAWALAVGGAAGSIGSGFIAAAAPWRRVALDEMQAALEEQRRQIDRVTEMQIECERERTEDRAAAAAAEARNLARIEALEDELRKLREMGPG